jgi:sigma-E factor negative regulatory protein RseC
VLISSSTEHPTYSLPDITMSEAQGIVTAIDGDYAVVRTEEGGCGRCHEQGGCGGVSVGRMFCSAPRTWRVLNPRGAVVGEKVSVAVAEGAVGASALLIYILPLVSLIGGAVLGAALLSDVGAIAGGAVGLLVAWRLVIHQQKQRHCDPRFHPHIV